MNLLNYFKQRSFKFGSFATLITVLVIVGMIIVNFVLYRVFDSYPLKLDLTTKQSYNISTKTIDFLKTIKNEVQISIIVDGTNLTEDTFSSDKTLNSAYQEIKQYAAYNHNIKIAFININANPAFAAQYAKESFAAGDILISSGSRYKKVNIQDFFDSTQDQTTGATTVTGNKTEQTMDSSLLFIASDNLPIITFTTGHSEQDSTEFQTLLKTNNYDVQTQNIATSDINSTVQTITVIAPKFDFTEAEIKKLDTFLINNNNYGKNVMVFFDAAQQTPLPNLEAFTKEWGIQAEQGTVYDTNGVSSFLPAAGTINADYSGSVPSGLATYIPYTMPLTLLFTTSGSRTTTSLIQTSDTSALWIQKSSAETFAASITDKKGPFTAMAVCTINGIDSTNNAVLTSNVIVSGSAQSVNYQAILTTSNVNNANVIIGIVNKIAGVKSSINIPSKSLLPVDPNISTDQQGTIILCLVLLPLLIIALGIVVWLRRRHR
jgi:ABC-2 type transport system permease protein